MHGCNLLHTVALQYYASRPVMVARRTLRVLWAAARFGSSLAIDQLRGTPNIPLNSAAHSCNTLEFSIKINAARLPAKRRPAEDQQRAAIGAAGPQLIFCTLTARNIKCSDCALSDAAALF